MKAKLLPCALPVLLTVVVQLQAQHRVSSNTITIPAIEAKNHIGEVATVYGKLYRVWFDAGRYVSVVTGTAAVNHQRHVTPIVLDVGGYDANRTFSIVIIDGNNPTFLELKKFEGQEIAVTGQIQSNLMGCPGMNITFGFEISKWEPPDQFVAIATPPRPLIDKEVGLPTWENTKQVEDGRNRRLRKQPFIEEFPDSGTKAAGTNLSDWEPVSPSGTNAATPIPDWAKEDSAQQPVSPSRTKAAVANKPRPGFDPKQPFIEEFPDDAPATSKPRRDIFDQVADEHAAAKSQPINWEFVATTACAVLFCLIILFAISVVFYSFVFPYMRGLKQIVAQMKPADLGSIIAKMFVAGLLFAAPGRHAYDFYTLLRCVACGVAAFTAFQAAQVKKFGWLFVFAIVAVALNPVAPLHLKGETWAFIDAAAAVLLLVSIATIEAQTMNSSVKRLLFGWLFLLAVIGIVAWFFLRQNVPPKADEDWGDTKSSHHTTGLPRPPRMPGMPRMPRIPK